MFAWKSPMGLCKELGRLQKKLRAESADYRREQALNRTLALYFGLSVGLGGGAIVVLLDWLI